MIKVKNLVKVYKDEGQTALSGIDLEVWPGEFIAIIGASGSGKTTLLRCLALKEKWTEGSFTYRGEEVFRLSFIKRRKLFHEWSFIAEKTRLNPRKTAFKNVLSGRKYQRPLWRVATGKVSLDEHMRVMDFLDKVGLLDKAEKKLELLSGGESQLVAIAKALSQGARVLVSDEPLSGLDPISAERVMKDLQTLCQKERVTLICSLNQLSLAEKYVSRIIGLSEGRIILDVSNRRLTMREKELVY